jgi:hypothetical protein
LSSSNPGAAAKPGRLGAMPPALVPLQAPFATPAAGCEASRESGARVTEPGGEGDRSDGVQEELSVAMSVRKTEDDKG